jgi:hypothetical protein
MSIADNAAQRSTFQQRLILIIREIEDRRRDIDIAQSQRPPAPLPVYLAECDFHLGEAQDELRRASARIGQI